jgi:hypothetical protein
VRFTEIRPALLALVTSCTGVRAQWDDSRRPFVPPAEDGFASNAKGVFALCKLNVTSQLGTDARIMSFDEDAAPDACLNDTIRGVRRAVLSIQILSFDPSDTLQALGYLETLRTRFASQRVHAALEDVGCALWRTSTVVPLAQAVDEHVSSIASLDVFLGMTIDEIDSAFAGTPNNPGAEAPVMYGPIDEVVITNAVETIAPPYDFEVTAP